MGSGHDRISALWNVEEALSDLEAGEVDLAGAERRIAAVVRTYATEFEEEGWRAYRASGEGPADGTVVVAESRAAARERARELADGDARDADFDLDAEAFVAAVRDPDGERVTCPDPGPAHEYVGHVRPEMSTRCRRRSPRPRVRGG